MLEYIAFCEDFHRRIADGEDHDFAEFDRFGPIADAGSWRVPRPDGGSMPMEGRMWFADGQASWQHPETAPSTELWRHLPKSTSDSGRTILLSADNRQSHYFEVLKPDAIILIGKASFRGVSPLEENP